MRALRLRPGEEIKSSLEEYCKEYKLSVFVATCVGSVEECTLRLANADRNRPNEIITRKQRFEILSLVGTLGPDGSHLHVSLADSDGVCLGGHLISATVFTTAEIVLGSVPNVTFRRVLDDATGFDELVVVQSQKKFLFIGTLCTVIGSLAIATGFFLNRRTTSS